MTSYPIRIEAVDETGNAMFHLETFDEYTCKLDMHRLLSPDNVDATVEAIRQAVAMLKLRDRRNRDD